MEGKDRFELYHGEGRTKVSLSALFMGDDLVIRIYNDQDHIGAVAVADYDHKEKRASVSVITRLGHKEDIVAQYVAHDLCKHSKKAVCVIAGIHLDDITEAEIKKIVENSSNLVTKLIYELAAYR
jgi:hypothetical protein